MIYTDDKSRIDVLRKAVEEIEAISHNYLTRQWVRINDIAREALKQTSPNSNEQEPQS